MALSTFALVAMLRQDDRTVWYLYLYPVLIFTFACRMFLVTPIWTFVWVGFMSMSLLAMFYALALRKPRHPVADARPHTDPVGSTINQ